MTSYGELKNISCGESSGEFENLIKEKALLR